MSSVRQAVVALTFSRQFLLASNVLTIAVVSRLLTPHEIGVSVLCMAICSICLAAREFATANFLIQKPALSHEDIRSLITAQTLISIAIAVVIASIAPFAAAFYREPQIVTYLHLAAVCVVIESVTLPICALMQRDMAFTFPSVVNVASGLVMSLVTIFLAWLGFSALSFVYGWLVATAVVSASAVIVWRDLSIFRPCVRSWREILRFGSATGVSDVLFVACEQLPYLLLGRIMSLRALALYSRGLAICALPERILLNGSGTVAISAYASELRNGRSVRGPYLASIKHVTAVYWPALLLIAIFAEPIVLILLGREWLDAIPLIRIMALASLANFSAEFNLAVLIAHGAARDLLLRSLIVWPVSAVIFILAAYFGLYALALSWFLVIPFRTVVSLYFVRHHFPITWQDLVHATAKSAIVAGAAAAGPLLLTVLAGTDSSVFVVAAGSALAATGWIIGLYATGHPLLEELMGAIGIGFHGQWKLLRPK
jgi:O-antigen/teichoic acid export membrane protein